MEENLSITNQQNENGENNTKFKNWIKGLTKEERMEKINKATDMTIYDLISYGNILNDNYKKALQILTYEMMFYSNEDKVLTIPLPTGSGKSTAMKNTIAYMCIDEDFKSFCGTIVLKLLIKDVDEAVKEINNKYEKLHTEKYIKFYDGQIPPCRPIAVALHSKSDLKLKDKQLYTYPVIVTTHSMFNNMVNNAKIGNLLAWKDANKYNKRLNNDTYYRRRVIVDEEFKSIKFFNITMTTLNIIENAVMNLCENDLFQKFTNDVLIKIKQLFVKSYKMEKNNILFTEFKGIEIPFEIQDIISKSNNWEAKEALKAIMNLLEHGAYIHKEDDIERKSFTSYQWTKLNCEIFNQILLDATADVNTAYKINNNYNILPMPQIKTYNNTYLHIFDGITGSRKSIIDNLEDGLLESIVKNIKKNINKDEEILIVANKIEVEQKIKEAFEDYEYKDKIKFTHYGAITGLNYWSECKKQFMIGIPLLAQENYCLMYYCNTEEDFNKNNNNMRPVKGAKIFIDNKIEELRRGTIAAEIIQALNRCQVRKLIDGDTPETHMYMINKDKTLDNMIAKGMPKIHISYDWDIEYISSKTNKVVNTELTTQQKLINLMRRIIEDRQYRAELVEKELYIDGKGIKKATLRTILDIKTRHTFNSALEKPLTQQFLKDYNIEITTSQYIKIQ